MLNRSAVVLLLAGAAMATLCAQQPQAPVFRGGTTIVPLDVTVLDKNGKPVTDLTQADFTVYEDDVKQDIRSFFPQAFTPQPPPPDVGSTLIRAGRSDRVVPQTRRTFLIVLGPGRIQYPAKALDGAMTFVRDHLLPQDLVAVIGFNRATDFTTDRAHALQVLERYKREHERILFDISEFHLFHPGEALPASIQAAVDALFAGSGMRSATEMLLGMNRIQPITEKPGNHQRTFDDLEAVAQRYNVRMSDAMMASVILKVYASIEYLRYLEGEKHLVYLGAAIGLRSEDDDKRLAARANDARVVIDIIHTIGVARNFSWAPQSSENITEFTGGYYTGVSYADKALAHIDESTRFSYLLGYAPSNTALDGKLRQVKVKVNRQGVTVQFHHGYYAVAEPPALDVQQLLTTSRLASAGSFGDEAHDIKIGGKAVELPKFGPIGQLRIDVTIDMSRISFTTTPAGHTASLDFQIYCGDEKQKVVGERSQRLDISADDETYRRYLSEGMPFTTRVPVTGVVKFVKIAAYDYGSDLVGTLTLTIRK